jgi:XRE family transcriptional regulator, aerobic/anaerobic benzoate catabolism transcriptional regulator
LEVSSSDVDNQGRHPYLVALGQRMAVLRSRRGMTRKAVAVAAGVSERHLANMEYGVGNASVLVLLQVAGALQCAVTELIGDITTSSPEWLMIRELLSDQDDVALQRVRIALGGLLGREQVGDGSPSQRIALIGLRGAGKSTLGAMLAKDLGYPFVELSHQVEKLAGGSVAEIQALYGVNAYRRYERRALEELLKTHPQVVIATPGGLVSEAATFTQLLSQCTTVWLKAEPADHLKRVAAQGDMRPMAASKEAMEDLKGILAGRAAFYSKAQLRVDTSAQNLKATFAALRQLVRQKLLLTE